MLGFFLIKQRTLCSIWLCLFFNRTCFRILHCQSLSVKGRRTTLRDAGFQPGRGDKEIVTTSLSFCDEGFGTRNVPAQQI